MKKLNLVVAIFIALITITSCNDKDDEIILTAEELMVQNSPWQFTGIELVDIVNNGNVDFDKREFEDNINQSNEDTFFVFNADGTASTIEKNPPNPDKIREYNWGIVNGNQLKFYGDDINDFDLFEDLKVTETYLEFVYKNIEIDDNVTAGMKYLLIK